MSCKKSTCQLGCGPQRRFAVEGLHEYWSLNILDKRFLWPTNIYAYLASKTPTWQSKNTMISPVAASPPVCLAPMSPTVCSCRLISTLYFWRTSSFKCVADSGGLPETNCGGCDVLLLELRWKLIAFKTQKVHTINRSTRQTCKITPA